MKKETNIKPADTVRPPPPPRPPMVKITREQFINSEFDMEAFFFKKLETVPPDCNQCIVFQDCRFSSGSLGCLRRRNA